MKTTLRSLKKSVPYVAAAILSLACSAFAGTFFNDFSSATVSGFQLNGGPRPAPNDTLSYPAIENGYLAIVYAETTEQGAIIIDDLDAGAQIESFVLTCKLLMGGPGATTRPADGMSWNFAPDLTDGGTFGEEGSGNGVSICFDVYDNGLPDRIAFDVKTPQDDGTGVVAPTIVASKPMPDDTGGNGNSFLKTGTNFVDVRIEMKRNGQLDLVFKGSNIFSGEFISGWQPLQGRFGIGARTGGAWQNHWVDDLRITTVRYSGTPTAPTILTQPQSQTVNEGAPVTFSIIPDGTPPFSYQWLSNNVAVAGATNRIYTIAAVSATANNAKFKVQVTNSASNVTSAEATLTVNSDTTPPTIVSIRGSASFNSARVVFSEPVTAASAGALANYSFTGLSISAVTVVSPTTVQLTTGNQEEGASYTLTVNNIKDTAVAGNTIAANTQVILRAFVFSRGFATWERWQDRGGETAPIDTFVANLIDPAFRPPDVTGVSTYLGSPRGVADTYGLRASAFFIPPQNGSYVFFMACDDNGYLFLSTDNTPANKKKIAAQPQWSDQNQWIDPDVISTTQVRSDSYDASEWTPPNQITLVGGQRYYIELDFQEGGGGDGSEVFYKLASDADPANGTAPNTRGAVIGTFADPSSASLTITQQPQNRTVVENTSATFTVGATGSVATLFYQWQKAPAAGTFTDIAGANGATYITPALPRTEDGGRYRVAIGVPGLTTNSAEATVTVTVDSVPPTLAAARRSFTTDTQVFVVFSELMQAASANSAGNYTINNGITVSSAVLQADGKTVLLTTSAIAKGTSNTLTVSGVRDLAGNQIAAASTIAIGFQRGAILVTADPGPLTFGGDNAVYQHLVDRGYDVLTARGSDVPDDGSTANGRDLIIETSTLGSGTVEIPDPIDPTTRPNVSKFKFLTIPAIDWEASSQDAFGFTRANGATTGGQTDVNIVDANHPLAAGLSAGLHTVVASPQTFSHNDPANPPVGAHIVATLAGDPTRAIIYGYDTGEKGFNDFVMPARRVFFFFQDNTAAAANADGWKLFDAAVDWAQNLSLAVQPRFAPPTLGTGGQLQLSWTGSGTLQQTDSLSSPNWQPAPSQANPQTITIGTTGSRFYRIAP